MKRRRDEGQSTGNGGTQRLSRHRSAQATTASRPPRTSASSSPAVPQRLEPIDASALKPSEFFARFIATRQPCLIDPATMPEFTPILSRWTNTYLLARAGSAAITVEKRSPSDEGFGKGRKVSMKFRELIKRVQHRDSTLYMTTQYIDTHAHTNTNAESDSEISRLDIESRYLIAPPLTLLLTDFPFQPSLFSSLIPHQCNLWFGYTDRPRTSGLHHDYHDNLYVLLRGRKRITLIEPKYGKLLKTNGTIERIHSNGLICYEKNIHSDGSDDSERAKEKQKFIERRISELEQSLETTSDSETIDAMKSELIERENVLDTVLDSLIEDNDEGDDDFDFDGADDYVDSDDDSTSGSGGGNRNGHSSVDSTDNYHSNHDEPPPNFSQLDSASLPASIPRIEVELVAPACLYIPASYFHEVFSSASDSDSDSERAGHMALNYWFLSPDRLSDAERPYHEWDLWNGRWQRQRTHLEQERERLQAKWEPNDQQLSTVTIPTTPSRLTSSTKPRFVIGQRKILVRGCGDACGGCC